MKIMKKLLLYIVPLLTMFSCSEQLDGISATDNGLETTISVVIPKLPEAHPQSRAMALTPQLQNLKLAVFDDNGYLLEYVSATEVEKATENETTYGYKVQLRPTDFPTYIHFIGNAPENIQFGTETEAIGRLFTEGGNEAYWQRIELSDGIKKNGDAFDSSVTSALNDVRLVRNFAWIQLENTATNFAIDSYCVVNTYQKGSIAPYNTSMGEFADFAHEQTHQDLLNEGYNGFIPAEAELDKEIPSEDTWFKAQGKEADSYAYFIYEREKALSNPPFILVKGTYTPESGTSMTSYYKVDLRNQAGNYFPLIRNFRYKVNITKVMHEGHATAALAAAGSGSGDVSTAIETEDYTNISNGVARIFVSYTDTTLVASTNDLKLRYKFMVFETTDANGNVTQEQILNGGENVDIEAGDESQGKVINSLSRAADDDDGWREITIQTTELGTMSKSQDIIIKGKVTINNKSYELQRKATITLTPKYTMQLVCDPTEIAQKQGTPFDVVIKVPGGLRPGMFPLDFQLEASNQSMTPDQGDDLPVVTGKSIIPEKATKTTIGFIKQIHYGDYLNLPAEGSNRLVTCHFKSNKANSATQIYADNKYFNQASTSLGNYIPGTFSNLAFNPSSTLAPGEDVTFSFSMSAIPTQGDVYVTLKGLEPADKEDKLVWDSEKGCYKYAIANLSSTTGSFKLTCVGTDNPASVKLSAYHFEEAEKEINVQLNTFSNLTFDLGYLTPGRTQDVIFTFRMSKVPSNDVFVTLTNLEPKDNTLLTLVDESKGLYKFITRPTGTSATINLRNTVAQIGTTGTVKLSSLYFEDETAEISMRYVIPQGNIDTGRTNTTYYIFADDPEKQSNNNGNIGDFTTNRYSTKNNSQFEIESDNVSKLKDGYVYIRYYTGNGNNRKYYVAKVLLTDLVKDGGCDISEKFIQK